MAQSSWVCVSLLIKNFYLITILFLQLEGGISHLPLLDPSVRATPLAPSEWRKRLEPVNGIDAASNGNINTNYILLDVRNGSSSLFPRSIFLHFLSQNVLVILFYIFSCHALSFTFAYQTL